MRKLLASFLLFSVLLASLSAFDIVRDGRATAYITATERLPPKVMASIKRFGDDIKELTGAEIPWQKAMGNKIEVVHVKAGIDSDNTALVSFPDKNTMRIAGAHFAPRRLR